MWTKLKQIDICEYSIEIKIKIMTLDSNTNM